MTNKPDIEAVIAWELKEHENCAKCMGKAADIIQALNAAGYTIQPTEPSTAMKLAGADAINKQMRGSGPPADYFAAEDCWNVMINAGEKDNA